MENNKIMFAVQTHAEWCHEPYTIVTEDGGIAEFQEVEFNFLTNKMLSK